MNTRFSFIFNNKKLLNILSKTLNIVAIIIVVFILISTIIYIYISNYSKNYIYSDINLLPKNKAGLLLGTSPATSNGEVNIFFVSRMLAGREILSNKKIEYIIVSGDNRTVAYNEPKYMRNYLLKLGVEENSIVSDYAGRRTLDSVLRSNEIFKQDKITIISQKFHNERAIFLARKNGIDAIAYNAQYPYHGYSENIFVNTKIFLREVLARDIAVYDVIKNTRPQVLGNSIEIKNENIDGIKRLILEKDNEK